MGQIKNIKLHIVTDIKFFYIGKPKGGKYKMGDKTVDMLFDPSMKKKKKKKAPINLDDLDDAPSEPPPQTNGMIEEKELIKEDLEKDVQVKPEKIIDDFDLEDFSNRKKKEKKKRPKRPRFRYGF